MPTHELIRETLIRYGLADYVEQILAATRPAIRITTTRVADQSVIPIGASKIGGDPDLPEGFEWPNYQQTIPLSFIAQFKLSQVTTLDIEHALPLHGMLYFFYEADSMPWGDLAHQDAFKVVYLTDEEIPLKRVEHPHFRGEFDIHGGLKPCQIMLDSCATLVDYWNMHNILTPIFCGLTDGEQDDLGQTLRMMEIELYGGNPIHHLLGNARAIQGNMEFNAERARLGIPWSPIQLDHQTRERIQSGKKDWQLLLQIDTDENGHGAMWGDVGMIYFLIRQQDLVAHRFDRAWCVLESA